jgi:putative membrane protein
MMNQTETHLPGNAKLQSLSERTISLIVYSISIVVVLLVAFMLYVPQAITIDGLNVFVLPKLNAFINSACTILLSLGFYFIRKKNIAAHRMMMMSAFGLSIVFLLSYVTYHSSAPSTTFGGEGFIRVIYFTILITHIVLAAIIVPLALFTLLRAWRSEFPLHKKIARWTLPIWLYVTITGVIVYLMISPYYTMGQ